MNHGSFWYMVPLIHIIIFQCMRDPSWYKRSPSKCLTNKGAEDWHVGHISERRHTIPNNAVDLFVKDVLKLCMVGHRETETLHWCGDGEGAGYAVHTDGMGAFETVGKT